MVDLQIDLGMFPIRFINRLRLRVFMLLQEKVESLEYHSLAPERLQDIIDDEVRRVSSIAGLEVLFSYFCLPIHAHFAAPLHPPSP